MTDLQIRETAAAGYDRGVGEMARRIVPGLLRAARLAPVREGGRAARA